MIYYLILLGIAIQIFLFIRKARNDLDIQIAAYENQKIIIGNQHYVADALLMIMKLTHNYEANQTEIAILKGKLEDLPN